MVTNYTNKSPPNFECDICDYYTSNKKDYTKHITTSKHIKMTNMVTCGDINPHPLVCACGNTYKYRQGLSRHKKTCDNINTNLVNNETEKEVKNRNNNASEEDELIK